MFDDGQLGVMLYVSDLDESTEFYRDKLDLDFQGCWDDETEKFASNLEEAEQPGYCHFEVGEFSIGLHPDPDFEPGDNRFKIDFTVDDVDSIYETLVDRGVEATEPRDFPWGMRMFTITDPDGHEISVLQEIE